MSTEEQDAAIGRLTRELTEAKKELALVQGTLNSIAQKYRVLGHSLGQAAKGELSEARSAIAELLSSGKLEQAQALLEDAERLPMRIQEIRATLKAAGVEL